MIKRTRIATICALAVAALASCQSTRLAPLMLAPHVDLERFMGDWYVIASIPTFIERGAHDAVESYRIASDGSIETTFTFRAGGFDGEPKRYTPRGYVVDRVSNTVWDMQFVWPMKADYRIAYVASDYSLAVIGREKRDYVWIMARTPRVADKDYDRLLRFIELQGYDVSKVRKVPQRDRSSPTEARS
jgi:apolipoprotein D and lipocalin family protein